MGNKLHYSPEALKDFDETWDYISFDLCSVDAAAKTVDKIINKVSRLEDFAEIGASLSSIINTESEYRFLVSGRYLIFYRISGQDIYIDRILYARRNYMRILFPDEENSDM